MITIDDDEQVVEKHSMSDEDVSLIANLLSDFNEKIIINRYPPQ